MLLFQTVPSTLIVSMRLDVYLTENGICLSRTEAKNFITSGAVTVDGRTVTKPSFSVEGDASVTVDKSAKRYFSRGGLKLEAALDAFGVSPNGKNCLDIGASSGGFTDCLLKRGAKAVVAVDSGSGQLVSALKDDPRVVSIEGFNARYMTKNDIPLAPDIAVMDVSFISATYIIPAITEVLPSGADFICLIKPQFEVGKAMIGKGGIVRSEAHRTSAVDKVVLFAESQGLDFLGVITSPITGGDGNVEYLAHFRMGKADKK